MSMRTLLIVTPVIFTLIVVRYFAPARVPGPMVHPWKYKIISGMFSMIIDLSHCVQWATSVPYYQVLNRIVDSYDPVKKRDFDRGQVTYHDQSIENVLVRIYTPTNASSSTPLPAIVFFHGGGFYFGSIYTHDTMNYHMSMYTGAKVIAINYQLTPTVRYPSPIDESVRVTRYVVEHHEQFSIDPRQIFLCGDSAGGNIAVVVERHLRDDSKPPIRGLLLLYPLLQLVNYRLASYRAYLPYRLLSIFREDILTDVVNFYLNTSFSETDLFHNRHLSFDDIDTFYTKLRVNLSDGDRTHDGQFASTSSHPDTWRLFDVNVSPLLADDEVLRRSPPTLIVACTYDVLLSDTQLYYRRLQQLNVPDITYREYRIFHGVMAFLDHPVSFDEAFNMLYESAQFVVNRTRTEG